MEQIDATRRTLTRSRLLGPAAIQAVDSQQDSGKARAPSADMPVLVVTVDVVDVARVGHGAVPFTTLASGAGLIHTVPGRLRRTVGV